MMDVNLLSSGAAGKATNFLSPAMLQGDPLLEMQGPCAAR